MISNLVGNKIREIRAMRKMTQQQLADRADIPRATLASMERDDSNPSLAAVYKIAVALDITIDGLLAVRDQRVAVTKARNMSHSVSGDGLYKSTVISPASNAHFHQQLFYLEPHSLFEGKPHPPGSEEYLHILEGDVNLDAAGEVVELSKGDSACFRSNIEHSYYNPGECQTVGIVTILVFPDLS
jgi:transcriptional regulator with XRE-family HTH domain